MIVVFDGCDWCVDFGDYVRAFAVVWVIILLLGGCVVWVVVAVLVDLLFGYLLGVNAYYALCLWVFVIIFIAIGCCDLVVIVGIDIACLRLLLVTLLIVN